MIFIGINLKNHHIRIVTSDSLILLFPYYLLLSFTIHSRIEAETRSERGRRGGIGGHPKRFQRSRSRNSMMSSHNLVRILAPFAAVAMLLSARADASSVVREGDNEDEWGEYQADVDKVIRDRTRAEWARNEDNYRDFEESRLVAEGIEADWLAEVKRLGAKAFVEKYHPERKAERLGSMVEKMKEREARAGEF